MPETILVTGGAGFIGSNFIEHFCREHPEYRVINFDKLTYAANQNNLKDLAQFGNYCFVQGDLADRKAVEILFEQYTIRGVVHFAAESHVDNSIKNPGAFISSNIVGTFNLLEAARKHWMNAPHEVKLGFEKCRFHHISTDEVFGTLGTEGSFSETTPYAPNSPYSASKASSDFLVRAYFHTYGLNVTTSNCSNNYGPRQHCEKLIPHTISMALSLHPIPVYGTGLNVRDWLYVQDHCKAVDLIFHQGQSGETYNIGGRNEINNITIVDTVCALLDEKMPRADGKKYGELITFVTDRPGHDFRYAIDPTKICTKLGWKPDETFSTGIRKTVDWYLSHRDFLS